MVTSNHIACLRVVLQDALLISRLAAVGSTTTKHYISTIPWLTDRKLILKVAEILNKSDSEIIAILANPNEDLSWFEPFAKHLVDPKLFAELEAIVKFESM